MKRAILVIVGEMLLIVALVIVVAYLTASVRF